MLSISRNKQGQIEAVMEWLVVNEQGQLDPNGCSVFVEQLEVNKGFNWKPWVRSAIKQIADWCPQAMGAYWIRKERNGNTFAFTRKRLLNFVERGERNATVAI